MLTDGGAEALASDGFREGLLANVNAGGENCHRGSALGALLGAAVGLSGIPIDLAQGLTKADELNACVSRHL